MAQWLRDEDPDRLRGEGSDEEEVLEEWELCWFRVVAASCRRSRSVVHQFCDAVGGGGTTSIESEGELVSEVD